MMGTQTRTRLENCAGQHKLHLDRLRYSCNRGYLLEKCLITSDPAIMMGKPVVSGTRITVELILEKSAAGETIEQNLRAHPQVTKEAIRAALAFAAEALKLSS